MSNGIPNQKYRAKRMIERVIDGFSGPNIEDIIVVTYFLDRTLTFDCIRDSLREKGVQFD